MSYDDYIGSEGWKSKRLDVLRRKGFKCERCGDRGLLHVHHATYKRKGNEDNLDLFVLCAECHKGFHEKYKMSKSMVHKTLNWIYGKGWRDNKNVSDSVKTLYASK